MVDPPVPEELRDYLAHLGERVSGALGDDLLGLWMIGSAAQGAYEHGVSDVDVVAVTRERWPADARQSLGESIVHPHFPCPAVGLEFVWYAAPDLESLADPVAFQLNVNGGPKRGSMIALAPDAAGPHWWAVLDLAAARQSGVALRGPDAATVIPEIAPERVRAAIVESLAWHDASDAGSPNRVLNEGRLILLIEDGAWVSKPEGARRLRARAPELADVIDEALRARAEGRWLDPALADRVSERLARSLR